jgi:hypothetical protein
VLGELVEPVDLAGETCWMNAGDRPDSNGSPDGRWLLPYFDAYVVGAQPRSLVFPGRAAERALARTQAGNFPVLLIDALVVLGRQVGDSRLIGGSPPSAVCLRRLL